MSITAILTILNQLRIYHWNTFSYSEHKAFGETYSSLDGLFDSLVETYSGKYGRIQAGELGFTVKLQNYATNTKDMVDFCIKTVEAFDFSKDADLDNIKQDILIDLNKLKYLLTLK